MYEPVKMDRPAKTTVRWLSHYDKVYAYAGTDLLAVKRPEPGHSHVRHVVKLFIHPDHHRTSARKLTMFFELENIPLRGTFKGGAMGILGVHGYDVYRPEHANLWRLDYNLVNNAVTVAAEA